MLPLSREPMALHRYAAEVPHGRTAGHLSENGRATRCSTGKEPCREELHLSPSLRPAKTSFSPRHTRIHDGGECPHNKNTQDLPSRQPPRWHGCKIMAAEREGESECAPWKMK